MGCGVDWDLLGGTGMALGQTGGHWEAVCWLRLGLDWFILVFTGLYWSVLVCTGLYWCILVRTGLYWFVLVGRFHYAARIWDGVKKSSALAEYGRLLG